MNGFKVFCIILIILGLGAAGYGFVRYQQETNTSAVRDPVVYDMKAITGSNSASVTLDLTESEPADGELVSTNGNVLTSEEGSGNEQ